MKSPKEDIRSAPVKQAQWGRRAQCDKVHTSGTSVRGRERGEGLFQVIHAVDFLLDVVELDSDSRACGGDVLERGCGGEVKGLRELLDKGV